MVTSATVGTAAALQHAAGSAQVVDAVVHADNTSRRMRVYDVAVECVVQLLLLPFVLAVHLQHLYQNPTKGVAASPGRTLIL